MGWIIATIILAVAVGVEGYIIWNILSKNEILEDYVNNMANLILKINGLVKYSREKLDEIDNRGSFKADDEIGWFFDNVLEMQKMLDEYIKSPFEEENDAGE